MNPDGCAVYENLYAAGSILAHQDWIRTKSGTGLAVATAYGAISAMVNGLVDSPQVKPLHLRPVAPSPAK
jgi:glycerol-3-phosphate dehydrogenase subunit B